jgi:hypothetical protein
MPSFTLKATRRNLKIAEAIKKAYNDADVDVQSDEIHISFKYGLSLSVLDIGFDIICCDEHWRDLMREIKRTLKGGKIREFNRMLIGIAPLRPRRITFRLSRTEMELVRKAADICKTTFSDFARTAVLKAVDVAFDKETARRMAEPRGEQEPEKLPYVS